MAALPDGYLELLQRYRLDLPAQALLYEQGAKLQHFFVVLAGRVAFEVVGQSGVPGEVEGTGPGGTVGVVSAFTQRPTSAAARAAEATTLLSIPVSDAGVAFQIAPTLAVGIIRELAGRGGGQPGTAARNTGASVSPQPATGVAATSAAAHLRSTAALQGPFDEKTFFKDDVACPVCELTFEHLRVRASAVRPDHRETDFRIAYLTVDPSWYALIACPRCGYASYAEDFLDVRPEELERLRAAFDPSVEARTLTGERSVEDAAAAIELALRTNETRRGGARRRAGLLHRAAWLARARSDDAGERAFLEQTVASYLQVFEQDTTLAADTALRVAYLLGDLSARLGRIDDGRRWLLECTRMEGAPQQAGLLRMARERLESLRDGGAAAARSA